MTTELIAQIAVLVSAISVLVGAGSAALVAQHNAKTSAKKDDLDKLRALYDLQSSEIRDVKRELKRKSRNEIKLLAHIGKLTRIMERQGLDVPPLPKLDDDDEESERA